MNIDDIAVGVTEYIVTLPDESKISIIDAVKTIYGCEHRKGLNYIISDNIYTFADMMELESKVCKLVKQKNIFLDNSQYIGLDVGIPFYLPYIVRKL